MRAVIQRVEFASVMINGTTKSEIGIGILVFIGIEEDDNDEDINWLCGKVLKLRIFNDENGIMNLSVSDVNGEIMIISQFTLHASTRKGNRPSYVKAAKPEIAIPLYEQFITKLSQEYHREIKTGEFGAMMKISLLNDGPVTILVDTKNKE
jgi:D-tyrosyl-tRNA(Tyr) deacylase